MSESCRFAGSVCREIGEREHRLVEAQGREAPCRDAVDPVPSVMGKVGQQIRIDAFRQPAYRARHGTKIPGLDLRLRPGVG
jgi:hypothetical protein